ncbi:MAG: multiheme c-type cytochrome [Bryobacteraceae bacterium]
MEQYNAQSKTAHARALAYEGGTWKFGSGLQAITPVSRVNEELYKEHGLTKYTRTKREALTPGHKNTVGVAYRVYDPGAQILKCFQCHSTGRLSLDPALGIQPFELGVRCESCHGPGAGHAKSPSKTNIFQPKMLNGAGVNAQCGNCHRQPPAPGQDIDWSDAWNARHQPVSFSQSACFRKSEGKLTCFTCHDPHGAKPARVEACAGCHPTQRHSRPPAKSRTCVSCHMPLVKPSPDLQFANHWIGVYPPGGNLLPITK